MAWKFKHLKRIVLQAVRWSFLILGLVSIGYVGYSLLDAKLFQSYESWKLDQEIKASTQIPASSQPQILLIPSAPTNLVHHTNIANGSMLGRIEISRLGISVIIMEGTEGKILRRAVGHINGTALPGEYGNVGLAGHRDTFFRALRDIQMGDEISLTTLGGKYLYHVKSMEIVPPDDVAVLNDSVGSELTLVTCYPFDYIGPAPARFIIHAQRI